MNVIFTQNAAKVKFVIIFIILSDKFISKAPPTFFVWNILILVYLLYFDLHSHFITKVQSLQLFPLCFWNILTPFFFNMATTYLILSVPSPRVCRFDQTVFGILLHPSLQIMLFSKFVKRYKSTEFINWTRLLLIDD